MNRDDKVQFTNMFLFEKTHGDMPDGAFFAFSEEMGYGADDWVWYAEMQQTKKGKELFEKLCKEVVEVD